jgi:uncharacterized protein
MPYTPRIVDAELGRRLAATGAVVIEGPKGCGKTATARRVAGSEVLLDVDENARRMISIDPRLVLDGAVPRLFDEWQLEPTLWNHVRRAVDDRQLPGQFILTGSAAPTDDITRHAGAGRLTRLRMRPMSLFESGRASGEISLRALLARDAARSPETALTVTDIAELVAVGGWPGNLTRTGAQSIQAARDYLDEIRRVDLSRVDRTTRDPGKVGRLLRALGRHVATVVSLTTLAADTTGADGADAADGTLARDTVVDYLDALERLMVIENQPAWAPHLRSRSRIRNAAKRHFVDPSLAVAALRTTPEQLLADLNLLGLLFESLVIRDLRVYAEASDATVLHYRDSTGLEVDAIVEVADGRWAAFEVTLGQRQVDAAAETLTRFATRVDTAQCGEPTALGVITATGYGYRRPDGVHVIPIGALGP